MTEQLILALEIIVDIAHANVCSLGNVAHGSLGVALLQKHTHGNLYNLFARIVHFICMFRHL